MIERKPRKNYADSSPRKRGDWSQPRQAGGQRPRPRRSFSTGSPSRTPSRSRSFSTSSPSRTPSRSRSFSANRPQGRREKKSPAPDTFSQKVLLDPVKDKALRIITLGGAAEVGKNMYALEYEGEIIIFECGVLFGEYTTPGISSIMPNIEYLKRRKRDIKAVILSSAALSHIGALPFAMKEFGNPTVYCRPLTKLIAEKQQEMHRAPKLHYHTVEKRETIEISENFHLTFFAITDETPSAFAVLVETPSGCVMYTGGVRVAHKDGIVTEKQKKEYEFLKEKKVVATISESVNGEKLGFALTDSAIAKEALQMANTADSRVILPLYTSQVRRNALIVEGLLKAGKKIYIHGVDMLNALKAAHEAGILQTSPSSLVPIQHISKDDNPKNVAILIATEENETYNVLSVVSFSQHRYITIQEDDTILFPNPMLPTRASTTQSLKNRLSRFGGIIGAYATNDVKALGYPAKDELLWLHKQINARFLIPVQGYHYMLTAHAHIAQESGMEKENCIVPENGTAIDIEEGGKRAMVIKNKIPTQALSLDSKTPCIIHDIVLQDRKTTSREGILILIILIDRKTLTVKKSPDIISRGFIYLKGSQDLIGKTRLLVKKVVEKETQEEGRVAIESLKKSVQKAVQSLLVAETSKKPVIVPVIFT